MRFEKIFLLVDLRSIKGFRPFFVLLFIMAVFLFCKETVIVAEETGGLKDEKHVSCKTEQELAKERAAIRYPFVKEVKEEDPTLRKMRLKRLGLGTEDIKHEYSYLSSSLVNTYKDMFAPVRFMHSKHAASLNGNCAACHHYRPKDLDKPEIVACRSCHKDPFNPDYPERLGLKAAYHQQCMGCHKKMQKGPVDCLSCHRYNPTDHRDLVKLPDDPKLSQVTSECLRCHKKQGEEVLDSVHWLWRGPSRYTVNRQKEVKIGKGTIALNNF